MTRYEKEVANLKNKFNVLGVVGLNDQQLYQRLQALHRSVFSPNDRIVIIQDSADTYDYADLPGQAIAQLQQYLQRIDISNYFVIVITGNPNLEAELLQVRDLYASNDELMSLIVVAEDITAAAIERRDTFCPLPWMHLYVGPNGDVLPCCVADHQYPVGNIEDSTPIAIANDKPFIQIRNNMLAGKRSKECSACYQKEDAGLPSSRQEQLKRWTVDTTKEFNPIYLDIRLNNICNLKCRMCSSYFSSAIAQEEIEIYGRIAVKDSPLRNRQRKEALSEIIEFLPHAEKIYFAGGEPLLAPEHYEILERLVDCGNTNLELFYNTNFTRLQFREIDVLEKWKQFSNVTVGASIDAAGAVAEYVRHGTVWSDIEENVDRVHRQCPHVNFTVTSTVGLLNARSLMQLQKSWHQTKRLDISKFSLSVMTGPDHLTVSVLPTEYKTQLGVAISDHVKWCNDQDAKSLAAQWTNVLNYMWKHDSSHYLNEFKRLTTTMDYYRKESFKIVLPEYQNLI